MPALHYIKQPAIVRSRKTDICSKVPSRVKRFIGEMRQEILAKQLEALLGVLRGEALLIATLSYGLGVRLSHLKTVRVRDVYIGSKRIVIGGRERVVPECILEDLRECLQDRLCGYDASIQGQRREQLLFSEEAFSDLKNGCSIVDAGLATSPESSLAAKISLRPDSRLSIVGSLHRKWAARQGVRLESPLELLDKGPRIVRRRSGGYIDSYYLWRASPVLLG
jgi:hypothetical protein